jgi:hypothetical protein
MEYDLGLIRHENRVDRSCVERCVERPVEKTFSMVVRLYLGRRLMLQGIDIEKFPSLRARLQQVQQPLEAPVV